MECIKCGYCCTCYDVIVPVDPDEGIVEGNLTHKPAGLRCHFNKAGGECSVHDRPWYKNLSCSHYDYGEGAACRTTPGPVAAADIIAGVKYYDPRHTHQSFSQDALMLLNDELVEKNDDAKKNAGRK